MVLVLAVHTVKEVSAKVSFSTILLQDLVVNKKVPAEFKCRQLIPTSGSVSTSLWDTNDAAALLAWLESAVAVDVTHTVQEVQEEFAVGLGDVQRARGAEAVAAAGRDVADRTGRAVIDLDSRLKISEKAGKAAEAVKESSVGRSTAAALSKAGTNIKETTNRVMESEQMAAASDAVSQGFKRLGASFQRFVQQHQGGNNNPAPTYEAMTVPIGRPASGPIPPTKEATFSLSEDGDPLPKGA